MTTKVLVLDTARGVWGAQSYLLRLVEPMARRGYELVLAAPPELELAQEWTRRGLPLVALDLPVVRSVRRGGDDDAAISAAAAAREAAALMRNVGLIRGAVVRSGARVIHANGHAVHLDAALAGRLAGVPVVLHLHEEMTPLFGRSLRGAAVALADRSIAVSRAVASGLPAPLQRRVQVVPNGVDVERYAPAAADPAVRASLGAAADDVLLVALTRLDPDKRIEDIIEALAPLRDRAGWHLAVVGTTSSYGQYAASVQRLGAERLGDRVTFTGRREDIVDVLHSTDIVVHAGVVEGMPLGLIEAQACGVPVVAYRVAGVPEAVGDGVTGLLAPARDTDALRRHVTTLLADRGMRLAFGRAGRERAVSGHSIETQADAHAETLTRLVPPDRRPQRESREPGSRPHVLLVNHWHDDNRGDSAITQGIVTLLSSVAPDARVSLTTLAEAGELFAGSTRHLERFRPDLRAAASPVPTELRGSTAPRPRWAVARDAAIWWSRLAKHLPVAPGRSARSPWRPLLHDVDLVVLVGGSNIFDDAGVPALLSLPRLAEVLSPAQAAIRDGTPVLLLGHTLGPFHRRPARLLARRMLHGAAAVVRETKSVGTARELGLTAVEEAADMAFAITPARTPPVERMLRAVPAPPRRTLAISVRRHPTLGTGADARLVREFAGAARALIRTGLVDAVALVPHTVGPTPVEDDRPLTRQLSEELRDVPVAIVDDDVSPAELSAFYGEMAAVVAVRLHAAILAVNAGTPTFAVSYLTGKTQGVMTQVGLPDAVGEFATVTADAIVREVTAQLRDATLRDRLLDGAGRRRQGLFDAATRWFADVAPVVDAGEVAA
jgi:glycosyltransferase involved in cell wall biosynthesis/polysaccharide pyruvyl transferase WcaK-like protein